jgi:hypothetical protein
VSCVEQFAVGDQVGAGGGEGQGRGEGRPARRPPERARGGVGSLKGRRLAGLQQAGGPSPARAPLPMPPPLTPPQVPLVVHRYSGASPIDRAFEPLGVAVPLLTEAKDL